MKNLKIGCTMNDITRKDNRENFSMIWNVPSNLEELYFHDYGNQQGRHPIELEFGLEMPKLTKLILRNMNGQMVRVFETQNFPVLERLYLQRESGNGPYLGQQTIFNILKNCPNLKSVRIVGLDISDPQSVDIWCAFLYERYKTFNVYIDIFSYQNIVLNQNWPNKFFCTEEAFEKYLEKTDLATFNKYTNIKNNYRKVGIRSRGF